MKMNRMCLVIVAVVLILLTGVFGCAEPAPAPAPTPAPAPAPTPTPAPAPATIKLVYHDTGPGPDSVNGRAVVWAADQIYKRTNGRVQMELLFGGPLGVAADQVSNLGKGLFQLAQISPGYWPAELPLTNLTIMPGMVQDFKARLYAQNRYMELPELRAELAKLNIYDWLPLAMPPYEIISKNPILTTADLKGLRIRGYGEMDKALAAMGALTVSMPFPDVYTALERGTVDGALGSFPDTQFRYKLYEVAKNTTYGMGFGTIGSCYWINLDVWNSFSDDIKAVFNQVRDEVVEQSWMKTRAEEDAKVAPVEKDFGFKVNKWSPEESAKIQAEVAKVHQAWIKDMTAKGLPAQKVFDAFQQYIKQYEGK